MFGHRGVLRYNRSSLKVQMLILNHSISLALCLCVTEIYFVGVYYTRWILYIFGIKIFKSILGVYIPYTFGWVRSGGVKVLFHVHLLSPFFLSLYYPWASETVRHQFVPFHSMEWDDLYLQLYWGSSSLFCVYQLVTQHSEMPLNVKKKIEKKITQEIPISPFVSPSHC